MTIAAFNFLLFTVSFGTVLSARHHDPTPTYLYRRHVDGGRKGELVDAFGRASAHPHALKYMQPDTPPHIQEQATFAATPAVVYSGQQTLLEWTGIEGGNELDIIGFYCPLDSNDTSFVDSGLVRSFTLTNEFLSGKGRINFTLTDTKNTCEFRYFQVHDGIARMVKASNPVHFAAGEPVHGHLALTENGPSEMRVSWVSNTQYPTPVVQWSSNMAMTWAQNASGTTDTYTADDMCNAPANVSAAFGMETQGGFIDPGFLHTAVMTGLNPGKRYYYRYGQTYPSHFSKVMSFKAAPTVHPDYAFKFVVYADMGADGFMEPDDKPCPDDPPEPFNGVQFCAARNVGQQAIRLTDPSLNNADGGPAELVLHAGDISYARGAAFLWDRWFQLVEPIATKVPYMVNVGNHEYDHYGGPGGGGRQFDASGTPGVGYHPSWSNMGSDSYGECGLPTSKRFDMPKSNGSNGVFWYGFDYGSMHVAMLSTEHALEPGTPQHSWLKEELAGVDRTRTPWLVVSGHRPVYNSENYDGDFQTSEGIRANLEPLLLAHKVDIVFFGHYHSYERTCPLAGGECQEYGSGTVHITIGSAGATLDTAGLKGLRWSAYFDDDFGLGQVTIANRSAMKFE